MKHSQLREPIAMDAPSTTGELLLKKIGHYTILQVLGMGGMGVVYRATHDLLGREVAIKTFRRGPNRDDELVERFLSEGRSLARLNHPNIVTIYELGLDEQNEPYIVMELVTGQPLDHLIESKAVIPVAARVRVVRDVCIALAYAHKQGIIHRDVKPSNIFVQPNGEIKLLDFGIAHGMDWNRGLTRAGAVVGSTEYLSPERIRGLASDARSDLFSAGIILYQLLEQRRPFTGDSDFDLMRNILEEPFAPPDPQGKGYPAALTDVIGRALAKSPEDRFPTADAMAESLTLALNDLTVAETVDWSGLLQSPPSGPPPPPPRSVGTAPRPTQRTAAYPAREVVAESVGVTRLSAVPTPAGFLTGSYVSRTRFFEGDHVRYEKIQETLKFYREHLNKDYCDLSSQARFTYALWIVSVIIGLGALVAGLVLLFMGQLRAGSISTISAAFVYFIQKVFQQREDHYRELAGAKQKVLEYGNHWLLVIQSIDAIEDNAERERRQSELVSVLTRKLGSPESSSAHPSRSGGRTKKPAPAAAAGRD